jgi:hypothetical protein
MPLFTRNKDKNSNMSTGNSNNEGEGTTTSTSTPYAQMLGLAPAAAENPSSSVAPSSSAAYRGFSSSIAGQFQSVENERVDACSLVCCGILQNDRDRYIMEGVKAPNLTRRITTHILVPLAILLLAMDCALHIPIAWLNQLISTALVVLLIGYFIMQCCKGRWKREKNRKRVLLKKYDMLHGGVHQDEEDDEDRLNNSSYWLGQSPWDLHCAHTFIGCYQRDVVYSGPADGDESTDRPVFTPPNNLCGCLWNVFTMSLCGICGCHLQLCGMCATAQEGREIDKMQQSSVVRRDYISFEPVLMYAPAIWQLRTDQSKNLFTHLTALSTLSKSLLKNSAIAAVLVLTVWSVLHRQILHSAIAIACVLYAALFLFLVHFRRLLDVSVDALVKCFASGFFLATTLAVSWELCVGLVVRVVMTIIMTLSGVTETNDPEYTSSSSRWTNYNGFADMNYRDYLEAFGKDNPVFYVLYLFVNAYCIAALVEEVCKYYGYRMVDHVDLMSQEELDRVVAAGLPQQPHHDEDDDESHDEQRASLPTNPAVTSAAPPRTLVSIGAAITISMVAVALGFACLEDLIYIFVYNKSSSVSDGMWLLWC